ncbi:peptide chain release factor 2 [Amycolatopsis suaedae]|uniref:Peptide chain release factor 2 n=1 Tax=Amycolatopsis suaedae TaxID=2510978 RepID=A0A4Q7J4N0_9PSEU|nr:peptide chain release factor 2 [Amycolatopsis suaedae]RZQ61999.1 peptide chain release factor 2 [Amycolatopsis suaedae]
MPDTTTLRELASTDGPFSSVYFTHRHDTEDAAKKLELLWRGIREQLADQGTPAPALEALEQAVLDGERPVGRAGRALVAARDRLVIDEWLTDSPDQPVARVSSMPYLIPLTRGQERGPAHVVAEVDRTGARITTVDEHGRVTGVHTAEGRSHPVHKVRGGGAAHHDIQNRAEETVRHNAADIAAEITAAARRTGAELVVLAGEVQARTAVREQIDGPVEELPGGPELDGRLAELLGERRRAQRAETAERFHRGAAHGLAVSGVTAVDAALREANVDTLLVSDPETPDDERLPYAALRTGAQLEHVGGELELTEGVGALLRHA